MIAWPNRYCVWEYTNNIFRTLLAFEKNINYWLNKLQYLFSVNGIYDYWTGKSYTTAGRIFVQKPRPRRGFKTFFFPRSYERGPGGKKEQRKQWRVNQCVDGTKTYAQTHVLRCVRLQTRWRQESVTWPPRGVSCAVRCCRISASHAAREALLPDLVHALLSLMCVAY